MNTTSFGTLNFASCSRQCSMSSSAVVVGSERDNDERDRNLAPPFVGPADDGDLDDRRVFVQHALDFGARDVLAAGHDHVLQPVDDVEIAVVVLHADVAGVEPAALERGVGRVGIAPVTLEHLGTAQHDLAAFARGDGCAVVVPDVELEVETWPPDAAELATRCCRGRGTCRPKLSRSARTRRRTTPTGRPAGGDRCTESASSRRPR